jgi:hypothetical protein
LIEVDVPGDNRDGFELDARPAQSEEERRDVVARSVGVDDESDSDLPLRV